MDESISLLIKDYTKQSATQTLEISIKTVTIKKITGNISYRVKS